MSHIYTCYQGKNADLIQKVCNLYAPIGSKIADITYGKGAFWKKVNIDNYEFYASDIKDKQDDKCLLLNMLYGVDFKCLPYENESKDIVVLDPPYAHTPGKMLVDATYNNAATTKGMYHKDIINLYVSGMIEALRVLKCKGTLWVKCQDEIESSVQKWSHIELKEKAEELGYYAKDLFVLKQDGKPFVQHKRQQHARKNHSYLWIFQKVG